MKKILPLSKTQQVEILPGQVMVDYTQLAKLWDKDRKTVSKLMGTMEALGISSSQKIGENRIHTLHSLSGWYVDGKFRGNYFSLKPNADKTAIVHAEVPTAQVITVELPDEQSKPKESSGADSEKSTLASKGENPSADGSMSHLSPQSNDSGNVGKSGTDDKSSDVHTNGISHLADSVPSSHPEAEGNLNGGKETTNHQHRKEDCHHSLTATSSRATEATVRSPMATITLTASIAANDSPEGHRQHPHRQFIPMDVWRYRMPGKTSRTSKPRRDFRS